MPVKKNQKVRRRTIVRSRRRQVAVLIDFSQSYGRSLLSGVAKFVRQHHEWSVQCEEWRWTDPPPGWLKNWKGDGVLARVEDWRMADILRGLGCPVVDVRGSVRDCGLPLITAENKIVASLVAEHLLQRGFRHYAFCGFVGANYSDQRSHLFQEHLAQAGFDCAVYSPPETSRNAQVIELEKRGLLFQDHLARWLKSLPKPVGIMTCNDIRGNQVMNACRRLDLTVPEEIAVVGVDNDEIFCELSDPPLSSVALDTSRIGYEAAALLEEIMDGGEPPAQPVLVPPLGIITRRSSDVLAMSDRQLAAGARFMRQHLFESLTTNEMARAAGMSRRMFERRFVAQVGRSPKAEVLRLRLERVKNLLVDTDWNLAQIAERTGFKYSEYLHTVFSQKTGMTPGKFRRNRKSESTGRFVLGTVRGKR
jgi:LacI family transcriptional regulator, galactose operon repressor